MNTTDDSSLRELAARLKRGVSEVTIRGDGSSTFLYVVGNGRSAEVSWDKGKLWVEFWDSLDDAADPAAEETFDSLEEVEAAVLKRLS